jgi:hypothetical protein
MFDRDIYAVMLKYNAESRTLTKGNKKKIQAVAMKFFRGVKGKKGGTELEINFLEKNLRLIMLEGGDKVIPVLKYLSTTP